MFNSSLAVESLLKAGTQFYLKKLNKFENIISLKTYSYLLTFAPFYIRNTLLIASFKRVIQEHNLSLNLLQTNFAPELGISIRQEKEDINVLLILRRRLPE